jgi:surface polysaccharide O-acyltransferase-like enzyme
MQTNNFPATFRLQWVDLIRALGAFLVVLAHVRYSGAGSNLIVISYYALTRVAVPLFFMASGYLLLSKDEPYLDFFKKRILKVFIPFVIWSVIYLLWKGEALDKPLLTIFKSYFVGIIRGPRENHLWFFYELFGLYLFTPILRVFVKGASLKDLFYFCGIWILLNPLVGLMEEFTSIRIGFEYQFLGGYIGYFIFGYLAGQLSFTQRQKAGAWMVFFISLFVTITGMYLTGIYGLKTQYFEDYLSVNVVLMSWSLFVIFTNFQVPDFACHIIAPLSRASFGIYLIHVIVMVEIFSRSPLSILAMTGSAIYMIPLLGLLGFAISFILIFVMQKIPFLKYIVP